MTKFISFALSPGVVKAKADLAKGFTAEGVLTKSNTVMMLTDEELGASLEYELKKTTQEVLMFNDKKAVDKSGVMKDGVLISKSRLLERENVRAVGDPEIGVDLKSFTGVNHAGPVIDKLSPIAVSISLYLHYNLLPHRGAETLYTLSLQHAKIILCWTFMVKCSKDDNLKGNDVVYFKLTSRALSSELHIGKVKYVRPSRDIKARKVGISFKHDAEESSRKMSIVDRPVRQIVKL